MKHVSTVVNNSVSQQALNLSMCKKSGSICMESHFHAVTDDLQGETLTFGRLEEKSANFGWVDHIWFHKGSLKQKTVIRVTLSLKVGRY